MNANKILVAGFLILSLSCKSASPSDFLNADLHGMVYDSLNQPIANATISIGVLFSVQSDVNGRFVLGDVPRGKVVINVGKDRYEPVLKEFEFMNRTQVLHVVLYSYDALSTLCVDALRIGEWAQAKSLIDRMEKIDSLDPEAKYLRALFYYKKSEYVASEKILLDLIKTGYTDAAVYLLLADIYENGLKIKDKAIEAIMNFLEIKEDAKVRERLVKLQS